MSNSFFTSLQSTNASAIILHRDDNGIPTCVTVPEDFIPGDIVSCLQAFGFSGELGNVLDGQFDGYVIVELRNVTEHLPNQSVSTLITQGARNTLRKGLKQIADAVDRIAKKV